MVLPNWTSKYKLNFKIKFKESKSLNALLTKRLESSNFHIVCSPIVHYKSQAKTKFIESTEQIVSNNSWPNGYSLEAQTFINCSPNS